MLANINEIIADVRSLLDEPTDATNKFWIDTEITRWANEGAQQFTALTRVLCKFYSYTIIADDVKNDREFRLSSDFITFDEGGILYNDKPIDETSLMVLDQWMGTKWREHEGTCDRYYRRGDYIGFYPKPTVGDTIKYYGIERMSTMVVDDGIAPLSGDYRMVSFRRYIRDYAMAQCWYKKGEDRKYHEKMNEFDKGIALVNQIVHGERNQPKRMIPAKRAGGRHTINALNM